MQEIVSLKNVSKIFKLYNSNGDRFKESLNPFGKLYHKDFYALKNVNLSIQKGECVAIIGQNGSGKSTLLKIITSILTPNSGEVMVHGRISSLLELGTGFNPDLTGRENIYFFGTINGFSHSQMDTKLDSIIEFADIGNYLDQPVRSYSSGMFVRLAFACAIQIDPEILIVDEALAVGDMRFVQKCFRTMQSFKEREKTLILVTHDMPSVIAFATRVIWVENGEIIGDGDPNTVVREYVSKMTYGQNSQVENSFLDSHGDIEIAACESFGEKGAEFSGIHVDFSDRKFDGFTKGNETIRFKFKIYAKESLQKPGIGILIKDEKGYPVLGINNYVYDVTLPALAANSNLIVIYEMKLPQLRIGRYSVTVALSDGTQLEHIQHHYIYDICDLHYMNEGDKYRIGSLLVIDSKDFKITVEDKNGL